MQSTQCHKHPNMDAICDHAAVRLPRALARPHVMWWMVTNFTTEVVVVCVFLVVVMCILGYGAKTLMVVARRQKKRRPLIKDHFDGIDGLGVQDHNLSHVESRHFWFWFVVFVFFSTFFWQGGEEEHTHMPV